MDNNRTIRLRTTPGESQNIQFKIEQEFDTIDFLSLSITQEDAYRNFCSDYGVVAGRVIANDGFGVENAKISIFIPLLNEDVDNQKITSIYPYFTPSDLNAQGVRYNLLPNVGRRFYYYQRIPSSQSPATYLADPDYTPLGQFVEPWEIAPPTLVTNPTPGYQIWRRLVETNHGPKVPVGTFPSKPELLDNDILVEVYEKYYKFTTKTNGSGDYMLFGVPVGTRIVHMDVDLSDIGGASLSVDDFLNTGTPPSSFTPDNNFKSSTNLNSLPQIENQDLAVDVIPFWGNLDQCEIGITRQDFNIVRDIVPSATLAFFAFTYKTGYLKRTSQTCGSGGGGTLFSDKDLRNISNMESLSTRIKAVASSSGGEDIDTQIFSDGLVYFTLPMYRARKITNEFGNLVPSPDGLQGIPTEGDYVISVWGDDTLTQLEEEEVGTAAHIFEQMRFRYDLINKKRLVYTLSTRFGWNEDKFSGQPTQLMGSTPPNTNTLNYPSNQTQGDERTFGGSLRSFGEVTKTDCFGNLFFPKLNVKNGNYCPIIESTTTSSEFNFRYFRKNDDSGNFLYSGTFLDITDVFNLLPVTSSFSVYGEPTSVDPAVIIEDDYGVNITNQTIPLRSTNTTNSQLDGQSAYQFPNRLNIIQEPYPKYYYHVPSPTYVHLETEFFGESWAGRYYFYFGFTENNNILNVIKERFN
jgi:hypothetical protein